MSQESLPGGKMDRRKFIKRVAVSTGTALGMEHPVNSQEKPIVDNSLSELMFLSAEQVIDYPDSFKPLTPEVEKLLLAMQNYDKVFLGETVLTASATTGGVITNAVQPGTPQAVLEAQRSAWQSLQVIDPNLKVYSDKVFFDTLAFKLPKFLAEYGIVASPNFRTVEVRDQNQNPVAFLHTILAFSFLKISKIERGQIEQDGIRIKRNVLYVEGSPVIQGKTITDENSTPAAQTIFGNIMVFERKLSDDLKAFLGIIQGAGKNDLDSVIERSHEELEKSNQLPFAADMAIAKLIGKVKGQLNLEFRKQSNLIHETRHHIDNQNPDFGITRRFKLTTNPVEEDKNMLNYRVHQEINPILSELKNSPFRGVIFFRCISSMKDDLMKKAPVYASAERWIIRRIIEFISQEPDKYGIKVFKGSVDRSNQILSQIDVLVEQPDLLGELCDKIISYHNSHLEEDVVMELSNLQQLPDGPWNTDFSHVYKVGALATAIGGSAVALEALRRRKKKVAEENARLKGMSRTERREYERKKAKGKSKP